MKRTSRAYLLWLISALVFISDQAVKAYILRSLSPGQTVPVIKNIFHISLVYNSGIAFGLFKGYSPFFIVLSVIVIVYILIDVKRRSKSYALSRHISFGLILGGACGNLIDRIRTGYVVDFLDFRIWPVFNIADSAITIGMFLLASVVLFSKAQTAADTPNINTK